MKHINTGVEEKQTPLSQLQIAENYFKTHNNKASVRELFAQGINSPTKLITIMKRHGYEIGKEMIYYTDGYGIKKHYMQYTLEATP